MIWLVSQDSDAIVFLENRIVVFDNKVHLVIGCENLKSRRLNKNLAGLGFWEVETHRHFEKISKSEKPHKTRKNLQRGQKISPLLEKSNSIRKFCSIQNH